VVAAAALATAPLIVRGTSCGHDFDFHLVSWMDALASWRHGILYPRWAVSPNFNAGEPRFIFYPPLVWMLGAALGAVLPWAAVPAVLTFVLLAASGLATRALARQAMEDGPATLAGCIAIFSGYALFTVYTRSAYAELAGGCWIPLMLLLALRQPRAIAGWRGALEGTPVLALTIAGAWLSNAPVGVIATYLLAAVGLVLAVTGRTWKPLARVAAGIALGLGLAAFYLVPAAWEQRWVDIREAVIDPGEQIANNFLFGHSAGPASAEMAMHDAELGRVSWIAIAMIGAALIGVAVSWRRGRLPGSKRWWVPLALIPFGVLVLLLPFSLPVWNILPKMRFLQFPWRWLVAVEAPLGIFVALAVWTDARVRRWAIVAACGVACAAMTVLAGRMFFTVCYVEDSVPGMLAAYRAGTGFDGTDEYQPEDADDSLVATGLPGACLVADPRAKLGAGQGDAQPQWTAAQGSCAQTFRFDAGGNAEHWRVHGLVGQSGYLVLRLREYPAWRVRVNGEPITALPRREDGLLTVPVKSGPMDLRVDWTATRDVLAGKGISLGALLLVTVLGALSRRRSGSHLS
jgi:hypothetical protein